MQSVVVGEVVDPELEALAALECPDDLAGAREFTVWEVMAGSVPPGPRAIAALVGFDASRCDIGVRTDYVAALTRNRCWLDSALLTATALISAPVPDDMAGEYPLLPSDEDFEECVGADLAASLGVSENTARIKLDAAEQAVTRFPTTLEAMSRGKVGLGHFMALTDVTRHLSDEECAFVESRLFPRAEKQNNARFRESLKKVLARMRPRDLSEEFEDARAHAGVFWARGDAGMGAVRIYTDAVSSQELFFAVDAEAKAWAAVRKADDQPRIPIGQLRVAVLLRWASLSRSDLTNLTPPPPTPTPDPAPESASAEAGAVPAAVSDPVMAAVAETLAAAKAVPDWVRHLPGLGADNPFDPFDPRDPGDLLSALNPEPVVQGPIRPPELPTELDRRGLRAGRRARREAIVHFELPDLLGARDGPAVLAGYGAIPIELARDVATDTSWLRMVTEPVNGHLLDLGRRRYRPSAKMRQHLVGLGQRCTTPGCGQPAKEFDHATEWSNGGDTSISNAAGPCAHHHRLRNLYGYATNILPDGTTEWITPAGTRSTAPPDDYRIYNYGKPPDPEPPPDPKSKPDPKSGPWPIPEPDYYSVPPF